MTFDEMVEAGAKAKWEEKRRLHTLGGCSWEYGEWDEIVPSVKEAMRQDVRLILNACELSIR